MFTFYTSEPQRSSLTEAVKLSAAVHQCCEYQYYPFYTGMKNFPSPLMPTPTGPHRRAEPLHSAHVRTVRAAGEGEGQSGRGLHTHTPLGWKLACGVNDNRKRCHVERLLGLLCQSLSCLPAPPPPHPQGGALITLPYNYLLTKEPVKVPVK